MTAPINSTGLGILAYPTMFFFFNDPATTEIYALSLHAALPIFRRLRPDLPLRRRAGAAGLRPAGRREGGGAGGVRAGARRERKSTRLNPRHYLLSYAGFCFEKKKKARLNAAMSTRPDSSQRHSA